MSRTRLVGLGLILAGGWLLMDKGDIVDIVDYIAWVAKGVEEHPAATLTLLLLAVITLRVLGGIISLVLGGRRRDAYGSDQEFDLGRRIWLWETPPRGWVDQLVVAVFLLALAAGALKIAWSL